MLVNIKDKIDVLFIFQSGVPFEIEDLQLFGYGYHDDTKQRAMNHLLGSKATAAFGSPSSAIKVSDFSAIKVSDLNVTWYRWLGMSFLVCMLERYNMATFFKFL